MRISARDILIVLAALAAGVLVSLVGVHTLELWLSHPTAFLLSHAAGLAMLILVLQQWISRRAPRASAATERSKGR
ncbi:MAG: hypothetical protein WKG32_18175 [Gemmatimonadaceae bacterium]